MADGEAVNNLYNNWGIEPDNYGEGQNALALGLTQWPVASGHLGKPGQWNDINEKNKIYFVVEYN